MENRELIAEKIPDRVHIYDKLFKGLNEEVMKIKNGLDLYRTYLHRINSVVQLSVIAC